MIYSMLSSGASNIFDIVEFVNIEHIFFFNKLLMSFRIGLISPFLQNQLCTFFHLDLKGVLSCSLYFLHSVLLSVEHFLGFDDLTAWIFHEKVLDRIVRVNRVVRLEETTIACLVGHLTLGWTLTDWTLRGKCCNCRRLINILQRLRFDMLLSFDLLVIEQKFGEICVRLS